MWSPFQGTCVSRSAGRTQLAALAFRPVVIRRLPTSGSIVTRRRLSREVPPLRRNAPAALSLGDYGLPPVRLQVRRTGIIHMARRVQRWQSIPIAAADAIGPDHHQTFAVRDVGFARRPSTVRLRADRIRSHGIIPWRKRGRDPSRVNACGRLTRYHRQLWVNRAARDRAWPETGQHW